MLIANRGVKNSYYLPGNNYSFFRPRRSLASLWSQFLRKKAPRPSYTGWGTGQCQRKYNKFPNFQFSHAGEVNMLKK